MFATAEEQIMATTTFNIAGNQVNGLQAEAHFVDWALALEQEHNEDLAILTCNDRCSSEAARIFQVAAYQDYSPIYAHCMEVIQASGITITRS